MQSSNQSRSNPNPQTASSEPARPGDSRAVGDREADTVPSNTVSNNCNNHSGEVRFLRWGIDSLYLSYQGELFPSVNQQLISLKAKA